MRKERREFLEKHTGTARQILEELLEKYAEHGTAQFVLPDVLQVPPISDHGNVIEIATVEGTIVKCSVELGKKVKETCTDADAGKKKEYSVVGTVLGKETKSKGSVTCPKAAKKEEPKKEEPKK